MAKRRERRVGSKRKTHSPTRDYTTKQAFQNIRTPNFPKHRKKALFRNTNISKLLTGQKSGQKSRTAQNAIKLQKQAVQKIKTQNFAKCRKKEFFLTHKYFQIGTCEQPLHNVSLKKTYFIRATPCQRGFAAKRPVHKFRCVCVYTKQSSWLREGAICDFWPFLLLPHFSSEMPIFIVRKVAVPEPPFRWTPNRPAFWRNAVPLAPVRHIYIYIYFFFSLFFFFGGGGREILEEVWREFCGTFRTYETKAQHFWGKFRTFCKREFATRKESCVPASLCRCAALNLLERAKPRWSKPLLW